INWLAGLLQPLKVWGLRGFYRLESAWNWRRDRCSMPQIDMRITVGDVAIGARVYVNALGAGRPLILYIHGGGWVIGDLQSHQPFCRALAHHSGCSVISLDYRLAPEHPIPAPLEDCYAGLAWLHEQASELGIDPNRIAVGGESAGGGLAAAVALHARDEGRYALCHQHLTYPMLDDRTGTAEQPGDPLVGEFVWNRDCNRFGWTAYLGSAPAAAPQVPARAESLAGLPPTWILTASLDLFRDENIDYANRLMRAGVHTDLAVYGGGCHAFQAIPKTALGWRYAKEHLSALAAGLGVTVK
ncbi:MAG: alpha/beta hydrolase, partial [Pseudomonadales bacterium]|nr:alpha/beta hydrolase [Pseudomonadales bacterium]